LAVVVELQITINQLILPVTEAQEEVVQGVHKHQQVVPVGLVVMVGEQPELGLSDKAITDRLVFGHGIQVGAEEPEVPVQPIPPLVELVYNVP
jgi:methyl coenzyme M reductase subunit D